MKWSDVKKAALSRTRRLWGLLLPGALLLCLWGCAPAAAPEHAARQERTATQEHTESETPPPATDAPGPAMPEVRITIGEQSFIAVLQDTPASQALLQRLPLMLDMQELNGNEKYFRFADALPTDAETPDAIGAGELMLYGEDCLVLFYADHPTSYSYTRLGAIENTEGLAEALGSGNVTVTFEAVASPSGSLPYDGVYPQHEPYGTGIGAMPGRVVWAHDPASVHWDGSGYWWELSHFDSAAILDMVNSSIAALAGQESAQDGWAALFAAHNQARGATGGYAAGQKIAIKANINGSAVFDDDTSGQTDMSYTNPALLCALLRSLVEEAGVPAGDITVYDVSRLFPDYMVELCTSGSLQGVQFVDRSSGIADVAAPIQWSQAFSGNVNYLPTCVTQARYVINLANLKGHSYGITLCGKNHFGSFINGNAMRPPEGANLHQWLTRDEMGIYSPLVDLMANTHLGGKTVLYMLDGLICAPSEGASISPENSRWQQPPFNGAYTSSVFVSQDPVAIDSVGADFLMHEPTVTAHNSALRGNPNVENYLHEAALVSRAPSGAAYQDGGGNPVANLGVHEHWNNSTEKQYSRNLGKAEGIELVYMNFGR